MGVDYSKMSDAELDAALAQKKPKADYSKMTDAELDAALAAKGKKSKEPAGDPLNATFQGAGQGLTSGYLPQLQAAADVPINLVGNLITGANVPLDNYTKRRDEAAKTLLRLQQENPKAFTSGRIAGSVAQGLAIPGGAATQVASLPAKAAVGAGMVAALRGIENPGETPGEVSPLQLKERAEQVAAPGLVMDFPGGGVAEGAAMPLLGPTSSFLKKAAERSAFKALGPFARATIKANDRGTVERTGRALLDKVIGWRPVGYDTLSDRAGDAAKKSGEELNTYLSELGEAAKRAEGKMAEDITGNLPALPGQGITTPKAGIDRQAIAQSMREDLVNHDHADVPGIAEKNLHIDKMISRFENGDDSIIPILEAEAKKRAVGKEINWKRLPEADIPLSEQVNRSLYTKLKSGVEDAATYLENQVGGPRVGTFKKLKEDYGDLDNASKIAGYRDAREQAKDMLSFSDMAALGGGLTYGFSRQNEPWEDPEGWLSKVMPGLMMLGVNKYRRTYGPQTAAKMMDSASKVTGAVSSNPWATAATLKTLGGKNGKKEEK